MYASDFFYASSTHQLLYMIFASEMGLAEVAHPDAQQHGIQGAFEGIREQIIEGTQAGNETFLIAMAKGLDDPVDIEVSYRREAEIFTQLYRSYSKYPDANELVFKHVYPLIGSMIKGTPGMKDAVLGLLIAHAKKYNPAVAARMSNSLIRFDLAELSPHLNATQYNTISAL